MTRLNVSQVKENVVETISKTDAQGIPEHFMALVNKILKEGKITGEADRIRTYKHPTRKDIEMDLDVGNGDIDVRFETDRGSKGNYFLKKGQADEATGGRTPPDEFMEGEEVYRFGKDGESYDYTFTISGNFKKDNPKNPWGSAFKVAKFFEAVGVNTKDLNGDMVIPDAWFDQQGQIQQQDRYL